MWEKFQFILLAVVFVFVAAFITLKNNFFTCNWGYSVAWGCASILFLILEGWLIKHNHFRKTHTCTLNCDYLHDGLCAIGNMEFNCPHTPSGGVTINTIEHLV